MTGTDMTKSTELAQTDRRKQRGRWRDSRVILFVLPVVLTILFPVGCLFYLCGRFSPSFLWFGSICLAYPLVAVFMFWCFFTGIMRLSGRRGKYTPKERFLILAETSVPLIFVGSLLLPFFLSAERVACGPGPGLVAVGMIHRVESEVDIAATRTWLQSLDKEDYDIGNNRIFTAELPESLKTFKRARVSLSADANANPKVSLWWGGTPSGHWGIVIGMEDMTIPQSEFSPEVRHVVPVEPGVYVWWGD